MKYNYEIKFFNNSFAVIENRNELSFGELRKIESKWTKQQLLLTEYPYSGYLKIGIASWKIGMESWNRSKYWLKENHPEFFI